MPLLERVDRGEASRRLPRAGGRDRRGVVRPGDGPGVGPLLGEQALEHLHARGLRGAGGQRGVLPEAEPGARAAPLGHRLRAGAEVDEVAVDVDRRAAPALVVAAAVLLHPATGTPAVLGDVGRRGVRLAVPPGDPDPVRQRELPGAEPARVVQHLDAGAGAGVEPGDVPARLDARDPAAHEAQRGLPAAGVAEVEALEVVPERAARADAVRRRVGSVLRRLRRALLARLAVVAARLGADGEVVGVAREPRLAGGLRAERDGQQSPAARDLGRDPGRAEVRLGTAGAGVAGDVDPDRRVRRGAPPAVHRLLARGQALVEAVPGEVAGRGQRDLPLGRQARGRRTLVGVRDARRQQPGHGREEHQGEDGDERSGKATHGRLQQAGKAGTGASERQLITPVTRVTGVPLNYSVVVRRTLRAGVRLSRRPAPRPAGSCPWPPPPRPAPRRRGRCPRRARRPSASGGPAAALRWATHRRRPAPRCRRRP